MAEQVKKKSVQIAFFQAKDNALTALFKGMTDTAPIADRSGTPA